MARRRAICMAVNISQIAVWLGLVMTALPIVAENTTWAQQPQTYTKHVSPHCEVCMLYVSAYVAKEQNKCKESMDKELVSFSKNENIPSRCLPGYELQENISPPSKASEPCICLPCNCEVPWQVAIIATIIAFFSFLLNVHLLIERKKHRQNDSDEGGTGTSARQAARLDNTNCENDLQGVTTSNGIPMTNIGESNQRSALNYKDGPCDDKSSDKDVAENSQNPPGLSILRRRKLFNDDLYDAYAEINFFQKKKFLANKDREYRDSFSLRGGYGEKTNVNKLSVDVDMPQTQQRKSEGKEDTEISSVTDRNNDDNKKVGL